MDVRTSHTLISLKAASCRYGLDISIGSQCGITATQYYACSKNHHLQYNKQQGNQVTQFDEEASWRPAQKRTQWKEIACLSFYNTPCQFD